jgi:hypothetical protein
MLNRPHIAIGIATAWWSVYALLFALEVRALGEQQGISVSWPEAFAYSFGGWLTWIPFSIWLYWAVCRVPIQRGQIVKSILILTGAVLAVVFAKAAYMYLTDPIFTWYVDLPGFDGVLADSLRMNFAMGWAVVGVAHALLFYHRTREREVKMAELEAGLSSARLQAIRARLNPHFMFNALNSISEMVHQDADKAENMLVALSGLLRDSLSDGKQQERPLSEEIARAEDYLMIEKQRLGERLQVEWKVDPACLPAITPVLIQQPLIENAIIHSIARRRAPGWVRITARTDGERLRISVNNSRGGDEQSAPGSGLGLESVTARLAILHGKEASFEVDTSDPGVFSARLDLPLSTRARAVA